MPMQPGSPQAQMPAAEDALIRMIQEIKRVQREDRAAAAEAVAPWSARTDDGGIAAGTKIVAGDLGGSRVELDSAGLRKYAADGTTVQVDLTGEVAAFSGLITGSEIVGGVLKTAASGARVEIVPGESGTGKVAFYSGVVNETEPAYMWTNATENDGYVILASSGMTGRSSAFLVLTTKAESVAEILADSIETNTTTLEWAVANGYANLKRYIFVVADATERAALVARYIAAPLSRVIDSAHPLFIWKADEAPGAQFQYTTNGTAWTVIGGMTFSVTQRTPTSGADTSGSVGDLACDDNYLYTKTSTGWKRAAIATW